MIAFSQVALSGGLWIACAKAAYAERKAIKRLWGECDVGLAVNRNQAYM